MFNSDFNHVLKECQRCGEPLFLDDGRCVGYLLGRNFYKPVKRGQHFLRTPPAIAIDEEVFRNSVEPRCESIVVLECDKEEILEASTSTFLRHSFSINRGYGSQLALVLKWWSKRNGHESQQMSFKEVCAW